MKTWNFLKKELSYFGIKIIDKDICFFKDKDKYIKSSIENVLSDIKEDIDKQQGFFYDLWSNIINILNSVNNNTDDIIVDIKNKKIFDNSLKELEKFVEFFDIFECPIGKLNDELFNKKISNFDVDQIENISNYQIAIDMTFRIINRLLYIYDLLKIVSMGKDEINKIKIKQRKFAAQGVAGPWAHLDLPMLERVFPFEGNRFEDITRDKQKQRRYEKWMYNYNNGGAVGEGHYWREIRNQPYSWYEREDASPYKHRALLNS